MTEEQRARFREVQNQPWFEGWVVTPGEPVTNFGMSLMSVSDPPSVLFALYEGRKGKRFAIKVYADGTMVQLMEKRQ